MTAVGFEPTQLALVELESTPLDHSANCLGYSFRMHLVSLCFFIKLKKRLKLSRRRRFSSLIFVCPQGGAAYVKLQVFWLAFTLSWRAPIFKFDFCLLSGRKLMLLESSELSTFLSWKILSYRRDFFLLPCF